jgi:hypothetical protein
MSCVESTSLCASPHSEIIVEDLSKTLIASWEGHSSSNQSSGSSALS